MKFINTNSEIVVKAFEERTIKYAFHDIDGTHSLIREWPPVMSVVLNDVIKNGLPEEYDSEKNVKRLVALAGTRALPETDKFCVESAGLSALTQMEWAIRRGIEEGKISIPCNQELNSQKISEIWQGKEIFDKEDSAELVAYLTENTPKLFRLYEEVLNKYCRDKNLAEAKSNPEKYQVKGSVAFLKALRDNGVKNYFVTGAVVEEGKGMYEEVVGLGYEICEGGLVEALIGSTWDKKLPKDVIMEALAKELGANGEEILVVGDGRAEISAGVNMGALTIGRLSKSAIRQRELQKSLGVHILVEDYTSKELTALMGKV